MLFSNVICSISTNIFFFNSIYGEVFLQFYFILKNVSQILSITGTVGRTIIDAIKYSLTSGQFLITVIMRTVIICSTRDIISQEHYSEFTLTSADLDFKKYLYLKTIFSI